MSDYYNKGAMFPKPGNNRKKKKVNGYKEKANRHCYYTGMAYAERHELFGGANRQNSIDHGLQVDLHPAIHALFHGQVDEKQLKELRVPGMFPEPLEWAKGEIRMLRRDAQRKWEVRICIEKGINVLQARAAWMQLIGVNCLDD